MRLIDADALLLRLDDGSDSWRTEDVVHEVEAAESPVCDGRPRCRYYHPNSVHVFPDACQFGRLRDSYPPDFVCGLWEAS